MALKVDKDGKIPIAIDIDDSSLDGAIQKSRHLLALLTEVDVKLRNLFTLLYGEDYED